jgi:hypothetical protein
MFILVDEKIFRRRYLF